MTEKNKALVERLTTAIDNLDNKDFKICFFVMDSKGTPNGSLEYIYETALQLHKLQYNVLMLHQEKDFVGVEDWLGEEYAKLPHENIEDSNIDITPSDFLIIPEIFANVMIQTKKLPCKRIALLQNFDYLSEFIPMGATWGDMGINEVVCTTQHLSEMVKEVFPNVRTSIVHPSIPSYFRKGVEPKKLIVNLVCKNQSDINKIVKPFFWKAPLYKWITFRDLRGLPREEFAAALREGIITVWVDDNTYFGYTPLEAMKSGNIVIGKIPEIIPEWMVDNKGEFKKNGLWFNEMRDLHRLLGGVINAWLHDDIPEEIIKETDAMADAYTVEQMASEIKNVYENTIFENRKKELKTLLTIASKEDNKTDKND